MLLKGKTALITGGSKGIGRAIAERFIREGASVIILDIEKPAFPSEYHEADISKEVDIIRAFSGIPTLDILINNAGVYSLGSLEDTKKEQLDRMVDINLKGTFLVSKHSIPLIRKTKGNIVNVASVLGTTPDPLSAAYCASKAGVVMLTKCMAQQYAGEGIRVNAVLPGPIDTPLLRASFKRKEDAERSAKKNPMKRIGTPEEVANVVLFLASEEAAYVTGGLYSVDGGESSSSVYSVQTTD